MNKKLYKLMDWPEIEGIIYADEAHPEKVLGARIHGNQTLIQAFLPMASQVSVLYGSEEKEYPMECMDEDGFYAVLVPGKNKEPYKFRMKPKAENGGKVSVFADPYGYDVSITEKESQKWNAGTSYHAYRFMGAHEVILDKTAGVLFRVWAPEAVRVSVIGEFNQYDGRVHPMMLDGKTGIFGLFIPGMTAGTAYQYEIRQKGGTVTVKADPYARQLVTENEHVQMSVVPACDTYVWKSEKPKNDKESPVLVYEPDFTEVHDKLHETVLWLKENGYTHVAIGNILKENTAQTSVHEPLAFYALRDEYCSDAELKKIVDAFHEAGIFVIADYAAACFSTAKELLGQYDGSCLYEHLDGRQGAHPGFSVALFHYARPQVTDFLISAALRLVDEFHVDGIRFCDTSFMLYLDYGKNDGEWIPNMYGGNENLEGIEFLKHCVSILKKEYPDVMLVTDEFSGWQNMTKALDQDGFGFDRKWNYAYINELMRYLAVDPINRKNYHHELTMSYLYCDLEKFMLAISRDYMEKCECSMDNMYGHDLEKIDLAQRKLLYAYSMVHPGSKYFMKMFDPALDGFVKDCNALYLEHPALLPEDAGQFEWINNISANECVLVFERKSKDETLIITVNFANCAWENHKIGVPYDGKYREIFSTDAQKYLGDGKCNPRVLKSKKDECDMRENSIRVTLAPLSLSVFLYVPYSEKELEQMRQKELERLKKQEEARRKKEKLKKEKAKIRASLKEELARKIAKAEEEIAKGSEYPNKKGRKS